MNRHTLIAIAVAALVAATGAAAAVPGSTVAANDGGDAADVSAPADGGTVEQAGPPSDLPGPVPDFVSEIHSLINGFLDGTVDALGSAVSGVAGGDRSDDAEPFPTETPERDGSGSDGGDADVEDSSSDGDAAAGSTSTPFGFSVDDIQECGQTCRDVTSTLTNRQDAPASDVTVHTRIFVGQGTDGDVVWRGSEDVGTLSAGESYTTTRRVELSFADALAVRDNGWITVQTTVETADRTVTFTDQRRVA